MSENTENKSQDEIKNSDENQGIEKPSTEVESAENSTKTKEIGGRKDGLDPTRYGDWEKNGRCIDF